MSSAHPTVVRHSSQSSVQIEAAYPRRLRILAAVMMGLHIVAIILRFAISIKASDEVMLQEAVDALMTLPLTLSLCGLTWYAATRVQGREACWLGMGFQVAYALIVSSWYYFTIDPTQHIAVNWLAVWMVVCPLFLPSKPTHALTSSLFMGLTAPLMYGLGQAMGAEPVPGLTLVHSFLPLAFVVALTYFPALFAYDLEQQVVVERDKRKQMGSYHLNRLLGKGGMGEVWHAEHQMLTRPAAIKLIPTEKLNRRDGEDSSTAVARFKNEASITASLTSPNTVQLFDFGTTDDGSVFYVMEKLIGIDLDELVVRFGTVTPARAARLIYQACLSLAEAHNRCLVHRDIKPANMYITIQGIEFDFVKVLDFGLATPIRSKEQANDPNGKINTGRFCGRHA